MIQIVPRGGRWTTKHKAHLVLAVAQRRLTLVELVDNGVSVEEFTGWEKAIAAGGPAALRVSVDQRRNHHAQPVDHG